MNSPSPLPLAVRVILLFICLATLPTTLAAKNKPTKTKFKNKSGKEEEKCFDSETKEEVPCPKEQNSAKKRDMIIAIVVPVVGFLLIFAVAYWIIKRRQKKAKSRGIVKNGDTEEGYALVPDASEDTVRLVASKGAKA